jgi:hypothetical protein
MAEEEHGSNWIAGIAEQRIQEAIEHGLFDNLEGMGKPLVFEEDSLVPAHMRIGHKILKNAGAAPEWVEFEREIEALREDAAAFLTDWRSRLAHAKPDEAARARREYEALLKAGNDLVLKYSLVNPFIHRAPKPFRTKECLAEWDALRKEGGTP